MTIEKSTLNVYDGTDLPDGTAESHAIKGGAAGSGVSAADLNRGYTTVPAERISPFDPYVTGENEVGDPYRAGGFLGRPRGNQR